PKVRDACAEDFASRSSAAFNSFRPMPPCNVITLGISAESLPASCWPVKNRKIALPQNRPSLSRVQLPRGRQKPRLQYHCNAGACPVRAMLASVEFELLVRRKDRRGSARRN